MRTAWIILFVFICLSNTAPGQDKKAYLHINKPLYIEGEKIHFNFYETNLSKGTVAVGLACLYSPDGLEIIGRPLLKKLERSSLSGVMNTSSGLHDGNYILRIFLEQKVYSFRIPIFENFLEESYKPDFSIEDKVVTEIEAEEIILEPEVSEFTPGDSINIRVTHRDPNDYLEPLDYSLSVYRESGMDFETVLEAEIMPYSLKLTDELQGTVYNDGKALSNAQVTAYFINSGVITSTQTDDKGVAGFSVDGVNQNDRMYIQAFTWKGDRLDGITFSMEEKVKPPLIKSEHHTVPERNLEIDKYIYQYRINTRVKELYTPVSKLVEPEIYSKNINYDYQIIPDNYDQLASIRDAIREVMIDSKVKNNRKAGREEIFLRNKSNFNLFNDSPLIFFNEYPTTDSQLALEFNLEKVSRIRLINDPSKNRQYWQMGSYGVFQIDLKPGVDNPLKASDQYYQVEGLFDVIKNEYRDRSDKLPFFTNNLYWNSFLYLNEKDELGLRFPDDHANYVVELVGINRNGELVRERKLVKRIVQ